MSMIVKINMMYDLLTTTAYTCFYITAGTKRPGKLGRCCKVWLCCNIVHSFCSLQFIMGNLNYVLSPDRNGLNHLDFQTLCMEHEVFIKNLDIMSKHEVTVNDLLPQLLMIFKRLKVMNYTIG